jgi:hypothetical protein
MIRMVKSIPELEFIETDWELARPEELLILNASVTDGKSSRDETFCKALMDEFGVTQARIAGGAGDEEVVIDDEEEVEECELPAVDEDKADDDDVDKAGTKVDSGATLPRFLAARDNSLLCLPGSTHGLAELPLLENVSMPAEALSFFRLGRSTRGGGSGGGAKRDDCSRGL